MRVSRLFHAAVHARPNELDFGESIPIGADLYRTLNVPPERQSTLFDIRFEDACEALAKLPRMFIEPDGAFVWVPDPETPDPETPDPETLPSWQIDGVLWDRDDRLSSADIKGQCPASEWDRLLHAFGWPQTPLMFQVIQHAVFLDEHEFRRWLHLDDPAHPVEESKS